MLVFPELHRLFLLLTQSLSYFALNVAAFVDLLALYVAAQIDSWTVCLPALDSVAVLRLA